MATSDTPIIGYMPGGGVAAGGEAPGSITGVGITNAGITPLVIGQSYIDVVFDHTQVDNTWIFIECSVLNTTDTNPLNIWPGITTSKLKTGFRLQLNGLPDSNNYFLDWAISGVNIAPTPATTFILSGPASGGIGVPAIFTVHLPSSTTVPTPVTVTPSDGGGGGTFSPPSVALTTGVPSTTFAYTPGSGGTKTISVLNNGGLLNPASLSFIVTVATGYSLSGPPSGGVGVASAPFTVTLTPLGYGVAAPVTVTPSAGGGGGTFTPTTVTLSTASPSATFTYTPASGGPKTIGTTNSGGLTNPSSLPYAAGGCSDTFTDADGTPLPSHTMDAGIGWTRFEGSGTTQMTIQSNKANSVNQAGVAYSYQTESALSNCTVRVTAVFGTADTSHYCQIIFRYTDASNFWTLRVNGSFGSNVELVKLVAGVETVVSNASLAITAGTNVLLQVILSGTSISVSAGSANLSTTDAFNQTATKHGIRSYEAAIPANTLDDFSVA